MVRRTAVLATAWMISLTVVLLTGYSIGYTTAFELQIANSYASNVAFVATLAKAKRLLADNEIERTKRFIDRSLDSESARLSDHKLLAAEASGFVFPQLSEVGLSDQIAKDALKWEEATAKEISNKKE